MATALLWWAALQALSLATVPLARLLFRSLPDRGYAFTKVLGPLLLAVLLWWSGSLSLLPNQRGTVLLLAYALVLGGLAGLGLLRREGAALPRRMLLAVVLTEVVFGATFAFWAVVRAYSPEIDGTEKPMDFAFLNASYRSRTFPPEDPWLSGFPIRYYYLGYLNAAALTRLVDVPTAVGYNLALATLAAQAATAACGLAYNLAEGVRRATSRPVGPLLAGLLAAVLLVGVGNLEGMLELVRARGWGSDALWSWVDVQDLQATAPSDRWYPTDAWFWWRATRIIHTHVDGQSLDYTITEFPFFSFLLGDLHPHVMALPLVLTALGMALQVLLDPQPPQASLRQPLAVLGPGALLGALGFTNIWDLPTLGAVILVAGGLRWIAVPVWPALARMARWRISQTMHLAAQVPAWSASDRVVHWVAWASAVGACAFLLYAPFFGGLVGTGHAALGPERNGPPVALWIGPGSRPLHLLLLWTPFLLASGLFLWGLAGRLSPRPRTAARAALLAPLVLWVTLEMLAYPGADPHSPLVVVWPKLWALGPLAVALALLRTEVQGLRTDHQALSPQSPALSPRAFAVGLVAAALGLLLLCELVYLRDVFNNRMNTVFKVSYQAWAFLAVASAFGLYYGHAAGRWGRGRSVVLGGLAVALLAAFIYVPMALFNRTEAFSRPPTLDGLAFVDSDQRAAVDWLWTATAGQRAVILEASGPQYSGFALMSSRTGLPTLLGWPGHEVQWRGPLPVFNERQGAIDRIYQAPDKAAVLGLLKQYGVGYVIVGPAERSVYSAAGLDAFDAALEVVFRQGAVTIYRVPGRVGRTAG